ncbi:dTDP-4-dehydrorhamnose 3,5-epimerase [bacterium]|nr:dTDP-4-dehydrorhamnose 3,5-epimerase [bacterium]|tara:strand:+ start:5400 stop:5966 length:567 start_codon:yes stop_codon:yes gene_type:complete
MKIIKQKIPEVLLLEPKVFGDDRGFFVETARVSLHKDLGLPNLVQHNQSRSEKGVLRGLHYQLVNPQGKLVRCSSGRVFDVAVDIRRGSPSFGEWVGVILDDCSHKQLWIPAGFAHGYLVLSEVADFCYLCSNYYDPSSENGIIWNDSELNISWPDLDKEYQPILSIKDRKYPTLKNQSKDCLPLYIS